jgi:SAM-dependent methyltransferase
VSTTPGDASMYGECFAPIFDAHLARNCTQECVQFLLDRAGCAPAHLLELGVGTGRVALPLLAAGHEVSGVESSPKMAAILARKPDGDRVRVIMGDFTDVALGGPYDLAYAVDSVLSGLDVLLLDVVNAADGWPVVEGAVGPAVVVVLEPVWQEAGSGRA